MGVPARQAFNNTGIGRRYGLHEIPTNGQKATGKTAHEARKRDIETASGREDHEGDWKEHGNLTQNSRDLPSPGCSEDRDSKDCASDSVLDCQLREGAPERPISNYKGII